MRDKLKVIVIAVLLFVVVLMTFAACSGQNQCQQAGGFYEDGECEFPDNDDNEEDDDD